MTNLGLIARADNRGLGTQTWELSRHLRPAKTMVVNCPSEQPLPLRLERFPGAAVVDRFPTADDFRAWLPGLDVVVTCETPYGPLYETADELGVKTVNQLNFEFLDRTGPTASLYAAPSMWRFDEIPFHDKVFLPVPIATDRFPVDVPAAGRARRFLHVVGRPAVHDRNGTLDLLKALEHIRSDVQVTIKCQQPGYVRQLMADAWPRPNVDLIIEDGDAANYWDNYRGHDVLVMPRRFGGLCLPVNEALGAGMPVIMPNIDPNTWLPPEWLVPAKKTSEFMAKALIAVHATNPQQLAAKIDEFTNPGVYSKATAKAQELRDQHSWKALKPRYDEILAAL